MKEIKVLGMGCAKCKQVYEILKNEVEKSNLEAKVLKDEDISSLVKYNISQTPAIVVDESVVLSGKIPTKEDLQKIISLIK